MFISAGSRKCSRKSRKRERQRRLQKLNLRKRNPPGRKQRNKMKKFLAAFLGALIAPAGTDRADRSSRLAAKTHVIIYIQQLKPGGDVFPVRRRLLLQLIKEAS